MDYEYASPTMGGGGRDDLDFALPSRSEFVPQSQRRIRPSPSMFVDPQLEAAAAAAAAAATAGGNEQQQQAQLPRQQLFSSGERSASPPPAMPESSLSSSANVPLPSSVEESPLPASVSGLGGLSFSELLDRAVANDSSSLPPAARPASSGAGASWRSGDDLAAAAGGVNFGELDEPEQQRDAITKKPFLRKGSRAGPFAARGGGGTARRSPASGADARAAAPAPRASSRPSLASRGGAGRSGGGARSSSSSNARSRGERSASAAATSPAWDERWDANVDDGRVSPGLSLWDHTGRRGGGAGDTGRLANEVAHAERAEAEELDEFEKLERAAAEELRAQSRAATSPRSSQAAQVHVNRHGSVDIRPSASSPLRRSFADAVDAADERVASVPPSLEAPPQLVFADAEGAATQSRLQPQPSPPLSVGAAGGPAARGDSDSAAFDLLAEISASFGDDDDGDDAMPWDDGAAERERLSRQPPSPSSARGSSPMSRDVRASSGSGSGSVRGSRTEEFGLGESAAGAAAADGVYQKIAELEEQISRIKADRRTLKSKTTSLERRSDALAIEREDFDRWRLEQQAEVEAWIVEQQRSIQKQKKAAIRDAKARSASANAVDRKDRAEINALKAKIATMQVDDRKRVDRGRALAKRQQQKIAECVAQINELESDVRFAEERAASAEDELNELSKGFAQQQQQQQQRQQPAPPLPQQQQQQQLSPRGSRAGPSVSPRRAPQYEARAGETAAAAAKAKVHVNRHGSIDVRPAPRSSILLDEEDDDVDVDDLLMGGIGRGRPSQLRPKQQQQQSGDASAWSDQGVSTEVGNGGDTTEADDDVVKHRRHPDGKEERWLRDGRHVIHFNNGTKRTVHADGRIVVAFANGDVKQTYVDGLVIYFYAEAATTHTTRPDGVELFDFPNGQQEKHYPNGLKVITFADETVKHIQKDGTEESIFTDGTRMIERPDGTRLIYDPSGEVTTEQMDDE